MMLVLGDPGVLKAVLTGAPEVQAILSVMQATPPAFGEALTAFVDAGKANGPAGILVARLFISKFRAFADELVAKCDAAARSLDDIDPQS